MSHRHPAITVSHYCSAIYVTLTPSSPSIDTQYAMARSCVTFTPSKSNATARLSVSHRAQAIPTISLALLHDCPYNTDTRKVSHYCVAICVILTSSIASKSHYCMAICVTLTSSIASRSHYCMAICVTSTPSISTECHTTVWLSRSH